MGILVPLPAFPIVPAAPGVPPLLRGPAGAPVVTALPVSGDSFINLPGSRGNGTWGIYLNGSPAIVPDSFLSLEFKGEWNVTNAPLEAGAFTSYNKVTVPFDARVVLAKSGSESVRSKFLNTALTMASDLNLYTIVTPEIQHASVNIVHMDYKRTATEGRQLIIVMFWLKQINVTASGTVTNTAQPSGSDPVNQGPLQPGTPTPSQQSSIIGSGPPLSTGPGGLAAGPV